jgi:glucose-1-phosphate thymidylyltransferase
MRGLILLGGTGSRLKPITLSVNKHFLPLYDKPLFYYPLSTLMLMGIKEICLITTSESLPFLRKNLGNGERFGCSFTYLIQDIPKGIPNAISIARDFLEERNFTMILGDNFFYGVGLGQALTKKEFKNGAKIFGYAVSNPQEYGVIKLEGGNIIDIIEKPSNFISDIAITGLYQFDRDAIEIAESLKLSKVRKEYEITDLIKEYKKNNNLDFELLPRGTAWLDTGSIHSLLEASIFVRVIEERQGLKIGCLEEIAYRNNWIDKLDLLNLISENDNDYYNYLKRIIQQ